MKLVYGFFLDVLLGAGILICSYMFVFLFPKIFSSFQPHILTFVMVLVYIAILIRFALRFSSKLIASTITIIMAPILLGLLLMPIGFTAFTFPLGWKNIDKGTARLISYFQAEHSIKIPSDAEVLYSSQGPISVNLIIKVSEGRLMIPNGFRVYIDGVSSVFVPFVGLDEICADGLSGFVYGLSGDLHKRICPKPNEVRIVHSREFASGKHISIVELDGGIIWLADVDF